LVIHSENILIVSHPIGHTQGIIPRIGLGIWQTLFMVTGVKVIKEYMVEGK
jgi:hypothetical protein